MSLTVHQGHVIDELRKLPAESVHCVVSSPPYWGLRDYKIPPSIWGGDPECLHEWGDELRKKAGGGQPGEKVRWQHEGAGPAGHPSAAAGAFCRLCNAWRGCHGLEPTPDLFVEHEVLIFREVRRVLRKDGTLWLNLGDTYATGGGAVGDCPGGAIQGERWKRGVKYNGRGEPQTSRADRVNYTGKHAELKQGGMGPMTQPNRMPIPGLKAKDLVGIPWRVALALQADGWWLRSDIIWHKPNPMPESTTDRPTKSHEYLFLLTKSERYFYDAEAIKEPASHNTHERQARASLDHKSAPDHVAKNGIRAKANGPNSRMMREQTPQGLTNKPNPSRSNISSRKLAEAGSGTKNNTSFDAAMAIMPDTRNKRSVWTVATAPYAEAHFATFPPDLVKPCILAGTSAKGCCPQCGAPWERTLEKTGGSTGADWNKRRASSTGDLVHGAGMDSRTNDGSYEVKTTGWHPTCKCGHAATIPCRVLDPFAGSGVTGMVALDLGRSATLIELNKDYLNLIDKRCAHGAGLTLH